MLSGHRVLKKRSVTGKDVSGLEVIKCIYFITGALNENILAKYLKCYLCVARSSCVLLRWPNTVYARFTDSASDAIKRALGLWYANTAVDKVIPQFRMKLIIRLSFDPK